MCDTEECRAGHEVWWAQMVCVWVALLHRASPVERGCRLRLAVGKRGELFQLARGNVRRGVRGGAGEREMHRGGRSQLRGHEEGRNL